MAKYVTIALLGILVGFGFFTYTLYAGKINSLKTSRDVSSIKDIQKNRVLEKSTFEPARVLEQVAPPLPPATITAAPPPPLQRPEITAPAPSSMPPSSSQEVSALAQEILSKEEDPEVYEGWANANFLPPDDLESGESFESTTTK